MAEFIGSDYIRKSVAYLESVSPGTVLDLTKSATRKKFTQVAKWYIDSFGQLEFNNDYSKLRKIQ